VNFGWTIVPFTELVAHGSSGKSTLAARLACALPAAHVLHTDDLAWHQGVFAWDTLLRDDVLPVVLSGAALDYRPPQWAPDGGQARSGCPPGWGSCWSRG
jgi:hypothetical protein